MSGSAHPKFILQPLNWRIQCSQRMRIVFLQCVSYSSRQYLWFRYSLMKINSVRVYSNMLALPGSFLCFHNPTGSAQGYKCVQKDKITTTHSLSVTTCWNSFVAFHFQIYEMVVNQWIKKTRRYVPSLIAFLLVSLNHRSTLSNKKNWVMSLSLWIFKELSLCEFVYQIEVLWIQFHY